MPSGRTVTIDRWAVVLAVAFIILWLAWFLKGADIVRAYVLSSVPSPLSTGVGADARLSDAVVYLQQLGQIGDLFGGFNALFAALACTGVVWAGSLQRVALIEARQAFEFERESIRVERTAVAHQQFESTFFQLLIFNRSAVESIRLESPADTGRACDRVGVDALEYLAGIVYSRIETSLHWGIHRDLLDDVLRSLEDELHARLPSPLGPYFRSLFHVVKLVDDVPEMLLSDRQKAKYCNIVRAQIPEGVVLLLAIYGLSDRGRSFFQLIERYGLLKYLPVKYVRFREVLKTFYRDHAFLGDRDRSALRNDLTPGLQRHAQARSPSDSHEKSDKHEAH